jgi:hypothetical protein
MMTQERLKRVWWLTGLVALGLLLVTVALYLRAEQIQGGGIQAYVAASQSAPFLRAQPESNGAVLMVVEPGSAVRLKDSATRNNQDWYFVDTGQVSGWLLASLVTLEPPEPTSQR